MGGPRPDDVLVYVCISFPADSKVCIFEMKACRDAIYLPRVGSESWIYPRYHSAEYVILLLETNAV